MLRQLLRRRSVTTCAAGASAILAVGLLVPIGIGASAAQASSGVNGWTSISICWNGGEGLCLWTSGSISGDSSQIQNRTYSAGGIAQTWTAEPVTNCGGAVTSSCPFTGSSSGLNASYINDEIVTIENDNYGYCIGASISGEYNVYLTDCTGAHAELWIMQSQTDGHWSLINVSSANVYDTPYELQGIDKVDGVLPILANCDESCGQYEIWAAHPAS
jgi:hypothetical protein